MHKNLHPYLPLALPGGKLAEPRLVRDARLLPLRLVVSAAEAAVVAFAIPARWAEGGGRARVGLTCRSRAQCGAARVYSREAGDVCTHTRGGAARTCSGSRSSGTQRSRTSACGPPFRPTNTNACMLSY